MVSKIIIDILKQSFQTSNIAVTTRSVCSFLRVLFIHQSTPRNRNTTSQEKYNLKRIKQRSLFVWCLRPLGQEQSVTGICACWKVGRASRRGVDINPLFSLSVPFPSSVVALPMFHPFTSLRSSFILLLNLARKSGEALSFTLCLQRKKWQSVEKVGGDQIHLVLEVIPKVGGARPTGPIGWLHIAPTVTG